MALNDRQRSAAEAAWKKNPLLRAKYQSVEDFLKSLEAGEGEGSLGETRNFAFLEKGQADMTDQPKQWLQIDEDMARLKWEKSRDLQEEFENAETYAAYCRAERLKLFKIQGGSKKVDSHV